MKKPVSFKFDPEILETLKVLAKADRRSQAGMLEVLVEREARVRGVDVGAVLGPKPKPKPKKA